ncbi:MAG: flagellar biosynthetic protein FliO [Gallionella sp.]|nr:flagellar biosynthetic protein FliO [Gallionella sp.]
MTDDRRQKTEALSRLRRVICMNVPLRGTQNLCLLFSVLCPLSSASASAETARPAYVPPPPAVSSGGVIQIIFSLLLVLAAIVLVAWLLKRMNVAQQGAGHQLKVLGGVSIGQRERIILVEIEDTWLVVGVGPGQIRTLHTLQKTEDRHQMTEDRGQRTEESSPNPPSSENKFARLLSSVLKHRKQGAGDK